MERARAIRHVFESCFSVCAPRTPQELSRDMGPGSLIKSRPRELSTLARDPQKKLANYPEVGSAIIKNLNHLLARFAVSHFERTVVFPQVKMRGGMFTT